MPLELWSDNDVVMVVCLTLLVRSAGFARIEEANGTQLTVDHVAHLLERIRRMYNGGGHRRDGAFRDWGAQTTRPAPARCASWTGTARRRGRG